MRQKMNSVKSKNEKMERENIDFETHVQIDCFKDALWRLTTRVYILEDFISEQFGAILGTDGFSKPKATSSPVSSKKSKASSSKRSTMNENSDASDGNEDLGSYSDVDMKESTPEMADDSQMMSDFTSEMNTSDETPNVRTRRGRKRRKPSSNSDVKERRIETPETNLATDPIVSVNSGTDADTQPGIIDEVSLEYDLDNIENDSLPQDDIVIILNCGQPNENDNLLTDSDRDEDPSDPNCIPSPTSDNRSSQRKSQIKRSSNGRSLVENVHDDDNSASESEATDQKPLIKKKHIVSRGSVRRPRSGRHPKDSVWDSFNIDDSRMKGKKKTAQCKMCKTFFNWPKVERLRQHIKDCNPQP